MERVGGACGRVKIPRTAVTNAYGAFVLARALPHHDAILADIKRDYVRAPPGHGQDPPDPPAHGPIRRSSAPARESPGLPPRSTSRGATLRPQRPRIRRPHKGAGHCRAGGDDGLGPARLGRVRRPDRKFGAWPGRRGQAIEAEPAKHDEEDGRPLEALPMSKGKPPHPWWGEGA